jgi:hypothetical protein
VPNGRVATLPPPGLRLVDDAPDPKRYMAGRKAYFRNLSSENLRMFEMMGDIMDDMASYSSSVQPARTSPVQGRLGGESAEQTSPPGW